MKMNIRYIIVSLTTLTVFVFSLASPIPALADDATPSEQPNVEETQVPDLPEETTPATTEQPTETPAATEEPTSTVESAMTDEVSPTESEAPVPGEGSTSTVESAVTDEVSPTENETPVPGEESAPSDETASLPEILEQAPEGTQVVVLNGDGQAEPMATVEAAEAIATSDPFWCPDGTAPVPGAGGCTGSFATFTDLLTFLDANDTVAGFQQNGTIFVTSGAYGGGEASIDIVGATYGTMQNYSLTLQGGWNSATNTVDSTSSFTAPVTITWDGSVFVNDVTVTGTTATGLEVTSNNNITIDQATVIVTGSNDAAVLVASGNVTVTNSNFGGSSGMGASIGGNRVNISNSTFEGNGDGGLFIQAEDEVTLDQVSASQNDLVGATIFTFAGDVNISNSFFNDNLTGGGESSAGLFILAFGGDVELNAVEANDNGTGALIGAIGNINIFNSHFDNNIAGPGLIATAEDPGLGPTPTGIADIIITNSTFNNNGSTLAAFDYAAGAELDAYGQVKLSTVTANGNHDDGLSIFSGLNTILNNVTASNNGWAGAFVETDCSTFVASGGQYSNNGPGMDGQGYGIWTNGVANGVQFGSMPTFNGNFTGNVLNENICVVPVSGDNGGGNEEAVPPFPFGQLLPRTVLVEDGQNLPIPCFDSPAAFTLPSGHRVIFVNLCGYNATLDELTDDELTGSLPEGFTYIGGMDFKVYLGADEVSTLPEQAEFKVSFLLPEGPAAAQYAILHWDGTQWVEVDSAAIATTQDGHFEAPVGVTGTYVLVIK